MGIRRAFWIAVTGIGVAGVVWGAAFVSLTEISSDPFTNTTSQHKTEVEPDTYSFGSTIVSGFQVGRFQDGGASDIGWATSQDGGKTWHHGFLPGVTKFEGSGPYDRASDASVAYDAKHGVWMISSLAIFDQGGNVTSPAIIVNRSADGGLTWQKPVTVYGEDPSGNLDKNWTTCDDSPTSPYFGNCYTEWDNPDSMNAIAMSTSSDGGLTWSAPQGTADQASGIGGQPVVQPNGTVIVPIGDADLSNLQAFVSKDGGKTWSATASITSLQTHEVDGVRTEPLPSAGVDASGKVYLVWQDCRFEQNCSANDIVMTTSTDGVNWSPIVRIPTEAVGSDVDHFIPGIAVDHATGGANAHLSLTYYYYPKADCTGTACELRVASVTSEDGGTSWTTPIEAGQNAVAWNTVPQTSQGVMVGDYISSSFAAGIAHPVFAMSSGSDGLAMESVAAPANRDVPRIFVKPEPVLSTSSDHAALALPRLF